MQGLIDQLAIASGNEALLRQLVVWLTALSVFVLVLGGATLGINYFNPVRRRVGELSGKVRKKNDYMVKAATAIGPVGAFVLPQDQLERNKIMLQLHQAGFRTSTALQVFYLIKTLLILAFPLIVVIASNFVPDTTSSNVLLYALFAAGVGMLLPNIVLSKLMEKRARALTNGFPDALDLLVVCVESGLGLASAIQRVADELGVSHPELAYELATVNADDPRRRTPRAGAQESRRPHRPGRHPRPGGPAGADHALRYRCGRCAARVLGGVPRQAHAESRGTGRQDGHEAGISAGDVHVPDFLHRRNRSGCDPHHRRV